MDAIEPVVVDLSDTLENPGDSLPVAGKLDLEGYSSGDKAFTLEDGISYDVVLTLSLIHIFHLRRDRAARSREPEDRHPHRRVEVARLGQSEYLEIHST